MASIVLWHNRHLTGFCAVLQVATSSMDPVNASDMDAGLSLNAQRDDLAPAAAYAEQQEALPPKLQLRGRTYATGPVIDDLPVAQPLFLLPEALDDWGDIPEVTPSEQQQQAQEAPGDQTASAAAPGAAQDQPQTPEQEVGALFEAARSYAPSPAPQAAEGAPATSGPQAAQEPQASPPASSSTALLSYEEILQRALSLNGPSSGAGAAAPNSAKSPNDSGSGALSFTGASAGYTSTSTSASSSLAGIVRPVSPAIQQRVQALLAQQPRAASSNSLLTLSNADQSQTQVDQAATAEPVLEVLVVQELAPAAALGGGSLSSSISQALSSAGPGTYSWDGSNSNSYQAPQQQQQQQQMWGPAAAPAAPAAQLPPVLDSSSSSSAPAVVLDLQGGPAPGSSGSYSLKSIKVREGLGMGSKVSPRKFNKSTNKVTTTEAQPEWKRIEVYTILNPGQQPPCSCTRAGEGGLQCPSRFGVPGVWEQQLWHLLPLHIHPHHPLHV